MKTLVLLAGVLFVSAAQATSIQLSNSDKAEIAFEHDAGVNAAIKAAKVSGMKEKGTRLIEIMGQCGFAGCSSVFLVSTSLRSQSINETTDSVNAIVQVNAIGQTNVQLIKDSSTLVTAPLQQNQVN